MKTENSRVFISYSSKDSKIANAIVEYLEQRGITCFIAPRDIPFGNDYTEEIINGINNCSSMVLLLTKHSNTSDHVRNEVERAFHNKKKLILFRIENIDLSKSLEYYLSIFQWLDASQFSPDAYFEQLYSFLSGLPIPPLKKRLVLSRKIINRSLVTYTILSFLAFLIFGIPIMSEYMVMNKENFRHVKFFDAIQDAGLKDIESQQGKNRSKPGGNGVPPPELYQNAKKEILITGVTLKLTLDLHPDLLDDVMAKGIKVKLLLLDPNSPDSTLITSSNSSGQPWMLNIYGSIKKMANNPATFQNKNMEVRFCDNVASMTGVMIDGDVAPKDTSKIDDKDGILRISPVLRSPKKHDVWFFQFSHLSDNSGAFTSYANEFRNIWSKAKPHPEYFK